MIKEEYSKSPCLVRFDVARLRLIRLVMVFSQRAEIYFWILAISLMKNKKAMRNLFILVVFSLFLAIAALSLTVYKVYSQDRTGQLNESPKVASVPANTKPGYDQYNLLVILIDRAAGDSPQVQGIWLIAHLSTTPKLTFLPIFPAFPGTQSVQDPSINDFIELDQEGNPSPLFFDAIKSRNINWNEVLILDKVSLAVLIDLLEGISTPGGSVNGSQSIMRLASPQQDSMAALESQALLASQICQHIDKLIGNPDSKRFIELLAGRIYSEDEFLTHFPEWSYFQEIGGKVSCEFPTFIKESGFAPSE